VGQPDALHLEQQRAGEGNGHVVHWIGAGVVR
jgi:hypothetical protein